MSLTAKAVVNASKRFAEKTPRTAACRYDGVQYRLSPSGVLIPPQFHSTRVVRLCRQRTFLKNTQLASDW